MPLRNCAKRPPPSSRVSAIATYTVAPAGECGQQAQRNETVARRSRQPRRQRHQRRLIDVSPREMLGAGDEVEFVAEVTVSPRGRQMQQRRAERQRASRRHARRADASRLSTYPTTPDQIHAPSAMFQSHHRPPHSAVATK